MREEHARTIEPARAQAAEAPKLETQNQHPVNAACGLPPEEIALMTARRGCRLRGRDAYAEGVTLVSPGSLARAHRRVCVIMNGGTLKGFDVRVQPLQG